MNRLWVRLSIGFLVVTLGVLASVTLVINATVQSSFREYVSESNAAMFGMLPVAELTSYYADHGSWQGAEAMLPVPGRGASARQGRGAQLFVADASGVVVAATEPSWIGQNLAALDATRVAPIQVDGTTVGTVGQVTPGGLVLGQAERRFVEQIGRALAVIALVSALVAVALGVVLAYTLSRPLQRLAGRIAALTTSQLGKTVPVEGTDEVRELAREFNAMSERLGAAERQRQQMTSDVAHELRTPVTVLRGHLEAMMDGVYPLDVEHLAVAYDQTLHLSRLVDDLRLLTQAEAGRVTLQMQRVPPGELVGAAVARFAPLAQDGAITLTHHVDADLPDVVVDVGRTQQIFDNLLTNALRHTSARGEISVEASQHGDGVQFAVSNTGELPAEQVAHLFDRFWRADEARRRDAGGSGLGLAITRQLVLLQGGTIDVISELGRTSFRVWLPIAGKQR